MNVLSGISPAGWKALLRIGIALFVGWLVGLIIGRVSLVVALTLAVALAIQLRNFLRVDRWVRRRRLEEPPDIDGAWGEFVAIIDRIYRRKQHHKLQVAGLMREFRRLTTAMPEGAVLLGPDHEILWFNPRAGNWLHLRRKRDVGIRIENLVRHPSFVEYLNTGLPEEGVRVFERGESNKWLAFNIVRSADSQRQLLIVRDVTREVQLEALRKDFVANASHELRSPLTVISGYLDALADDANLDSAWSAPVQEMRRQAERMGLIISDLLELSKLESGQKTTQQEPVDIAELLASLRQESMVLEQRPHQIKVIVDSDALLRASESEIHSTVSNLLTNAIKYTPQDGEIEMRWWTDEDGAHLAVRDTGVGIAAEHLPRLTERFYRVDSGRARDVGGSGLGLAIVKHALQQHEGSLTIDSTLGRGSTFTCHFPVSRVVPREQVQTPQPKSVAAT